MTDRDRPIDGERSPKADRYAKRLPSGPIKPPRGCLPAAAALGFLYRLFLSPVFRSRRHGARVHPPRSAAPSGRGARRRALLAGSRADNGRVRWGAFTYSRYVDKLASSPAALSGLELAFVDQVAQLSAAQGRPLSAWQRHLLERAFLTDRPLGPPHTHQ